MGSKRREDAWKSEIPAQIRELLYDLDIAHVNRKWGKPVDNEPLQLRRQIGELVAAYAAKAGGASMPSAINTLARSLGVSMRYLYDHVKISDRPQADFNRWVRDGLSYTQVVEKLTGRDRHKEQGGGRQPSDSGQAGAQGTKGAGRYEGLRAVLVEVPAKIKSKTMAFDAIERAIGAALPPTARTQAVWWGNPEDTTRRPQARAWKMAGFRVKRVNLTKRRVEFVRE